MTLRINNRAEAIELGSILGDAAREIGLMALRVIVAPALAFARYVDRCDD